MAERTLTGARNFSAALALLERYDVARRHAGHDYGAGQRALELTKLRAEHSGRFGGLELEAPTAVEMLDAFERVARPRIRRLELEAYRAGTPATRHTVRTWNRLEHQLWHELEMAHARARGEAHRLLALERRRLDIARRSRYAEPTTTEGA